ncbi:hypothetical protein FRC10_009156 [Ceratobasidium sp. 414]|nr:hypothetical protein FRC10_009156 [Ceratobasidium sp. 414]
MSRPLLYPQPSFYPLGNTPAVCLTRDLSSEQPADILLLGCGDPRNILFTLYADLVIPPELRKFDITCCDVEPATLARNALLFSLLDDREDIHRIWDIFHHLKIDDTALQLLTRQSRRLYELAKDIETWRQSSLPSAHLDKLRQEQIRSSKATLDKYVQKELGPSRAAGMMWMEAYEPMSDAYVHYWKTGTTSSLATEIQNAKHINPTFVYLISGESFAADRGTFPQGFHLMPAFVPIASNPMAPRGSNAGTSPNEISKQQFKAWCDAFCVSRAAGKITIRFYSGDALAFCRALDLYASTGCTTPDLFVSPWHGAQIHLGDLPGSTPPAPTSFDVIDTSNLPDHLGLFNLLLAAQPLLKADPISQSVLYTEQMTIQRVGATIARPFVERMFATIPTVSALLGVAPLAYISGFTTHSNVQEILANASQSLKRITWVDPIRGDPNASSRRLSVQSDPEDLAHILFSVYNNILPHEQGMSSRVNSHYHQETIAALFLLVKRRVRVKTGTWDAVATNFLALVANDQKRPLAKETYQDLCLQLHLYGVYTAQALKSDWFTHFCIESPSPVVGNWSNAPHTLCVVLTVPHQYIRVLSSDDIPMLQCRLTTRGSNPSTFSVIHAVWEKLVPAAGSDLVILEEDSRGPTGQSDLVVSFWSPTYILQHESTSVALTLIPNRHSAAFSDILGPQLDIFGAKLSDEQDVQLLPYRPASPSTCPPLPQHPASPPHFNLSLDGSPSSIGVSNKDGICNVSSFTSRVEIHSPNEQKLLLDGVNPTVVQVSPCTMRLSIASYCHIIPYPYPIFGTRHKLRLARKSHYVEES